MLNDDGTAEQNAQVYSAAGRLQAEFVLGDGVEHLQTTSTGDIWVGYSDEGVYGDYDWRAVLGSDPPAAAGLARFDRGGTELWRYSAPSGLGPIDDCYALNVTDVATYAYYYSDFPLVRITSVDLRTWRTDLVGASAFAVDGACVLFAGGYRDDPGRVVFARLGAGTLDQRVACRFRLPGGGALLKHAVYIGRGPVMHVFAGTVWYQVQLGAVQHAANEMVPPA